MNRKVRQLRVHPIRNLPHHLQEDTWNLFVLPLFVYFFFLAVFSVEFLTTLPSFWATQISTVWPF